MNYYSDVLTIHPRFTLHQSKFSPDISDLSEAENNQWICHYPSFIEIADAMTDDCGLSVEVSVFHSHSNEIIDF